MLLSFFLNPIAFVAHRLGRFWCETGAVTPARADESGMASIGLYRRNLFRMIIERIEPPPYNRRFLESRLAYRIQELAYGGLKKETVERLRVLAKQYDGKPGGRSK